MKRIRVPVAALLAASAYAGVVRAQQPADSGRGASGAGSSSRATQSDSAPAAPARQAQARAQIDVRAQLVARGLTASLAESVAVVARETAGKGLSGRLIVDKAVEGWFKHVPPPRILAAVRDLSARMERARTELRAAGMTEVDAAVVGAAAEARSQGIARADEVAIIRSAPSAAAAASGLSVSAALVVQGIDAGTSARLVIESFSAGRSVLQVLDLPAAARALEVRGTPPGDVGRQLLEGISAGASGSAHGRGNVRAPLIPPGLGAKP